MSELRQVNDMLIADIEKAAEGLAEVHVTFPARYEYDDGTAAITVTGWYPMTAKEREAADRRAAKSKAAAARQREKQREKDEQEFARLAKKLGK